MRPEFLLFSYAKVFFDDCGFQNGIWRFVLKSHEGGVPFEAFDNEDGWHVDRLNLLAVVRGLESLEQPSNVTLFSPSRYITRGFDTSLTMWKKHDWMWERFGEEVPIKNQDLWLRVDQALRFHDVQCRFYRTDGGHTSVKSMSQRQRRTVRPAEPMLEACG